MKNINPKTNEQGIAFDYPDNDWEEYKGIFITILFPSGYYQYYSDKQQRFLTFDCFDDCKESIDKE